MSAFETWWAVALGLREDLDKAEAERDRYKKALEGIMSMVTWEGDNPGYPLNPDMRGRLLAGRYALEDKP